MKNASMVQMPKVAITVAMLLLITVPVWFGCSADSERISSVEPGNQPGPSLVAPPGELPPPWVPLFSTQLSCGLLGIQSQELISAEKTVRFEIDVFFDETNPFNKWPEQRILEIQNYGTTASGYRATLTDAGGALPWEFDRQNDPNDPGHFSIVEKTPADEMLIEQWITDTSVTESYTINGIGESFYFPTGDLDSIASVHDALLSGGMSRQSSDPLVQALNDFDNFYTTSNSLHDNREGCVVSQFLINQDIADWLILQNPVIVNGELSYVIPDWLCLLAGECALIKCPVGGPANAVCDVCFGVVVICFLERLWDEIT